MGDATLAGDNAEVTRAGRRVGSILVALALMFTALVLVEHRADAAPAHAGTAVAAAVAAAPTAAADAQIDVAALIRSIVCPILNQLRSAFGGVFGGFVVPIIEQLQVAFGCTVVSGG